MNNEIQSTLWKYLCTTYNEIFITVNICYKKIWQKSKYLDISNSIFLMKKSTKKFIYGYFQGRASPAGEKISTMSVKLFLFFAKNILYFGSLTSKYYFSGQILINIWLRNEQNPAIYFLQLFLYLISMNSSKVQCCLYTLIGHFHSFTLIQPEQIIHSWEVAPSQGTPQRSVEPFGCAVCAPLAGSPLPCQTRA